MSDSENKKGLENEREKIIQNKIEKLESELKKEKEKRRDLENKIEKIRPNSNNVSKVEDKASNGISRRDFLKKAGLGSVGLAALGLSPASALNLRSDSLSFADSDLEYLNIDTENQEVSIDNADLRLNGGDISGIGELKLPKTKASNDDRLWLDTSAEELKIKIGGNVYISKIQLAIPGSVLHRWRLDDIDDGEVLDSIGESNGEVNGIESVASSNYQEGYAAENDGAGDIDVGDLDDFGTTTIDSDHAIAFTVVNASISSGSERLIGDLDSENTSWNVTHDADRGIQVTMRDDDGVNSTESWDTGITDDITRILINFNGGITNRGNWDCYVADETNKSYSAVDTTNTSNSVADGGLSNLTSFQLLSA